MGFYRKGHTYPARQVILGDVNHDGVIDIFDWVMLGVAFGSRPGDANWNPH
jgi:hypothetical protein